VRDVLYAAPIRTQRAVGKAEAGPTIRWDTSLKITDALVWSIPAGIHSCRRTDASRFQAPIRDQRTVKVFFYLRRVSEIDPRGEGSGPPLQPWLALPPCFCLSVLSRPTCAAQGRM